MPRATKSGALAGKTLEDFPAALKLFDRRKNAPLVPKQIAAGSGKQLWWRCEVGPDHQWSKKVSTQVVCKGCPFCAGKRVSVTNRLSTVAPWLCDEWHPKKNGKATPDDFVWGSNRRVWWKCRKGRDHEWDETINARTQGRSCPFCASRRVSLTNCLATVAPAVAAEWHPKKNLSLTPKHVVAGSDLRVWWKCPKGPDHEWQATIINRTHGRGCPFCVGKPIKRISVTNSLAARAPWLIREWHPTKNGERTPYNVPPGTLKKAWWKCPVLPEHEWEAKILSRYHGAGCPVCAGYLVVPSTSLAAVFPLLAAQWHPTKNSELTPEQVAPHARRAVWWKCPGGPDHEWQRAVHQRSAGGRPPLCPFCLNARVSVTNSLKTLFPHIAREWHPKLNEELSPAMVVSGSGKQAWWKCQFGHVWKAKIASRTRLGSGCPLAAPFP
jgi:hypothetical protein